MHTISKKQLIYIIFSIGLIIRLWGITNPLTDFHSWRQADTAMVAYNFHTKSMNIFSPSTNLIIENVKGDLRAIEFPMYAYSVAVIYKIFGYYDVIGRLMSVM